MSRLVRKSGCMKRRTPQFPILSPFRLIWICGMWNEISNAHRWGRPTSSNTQSQSQTTATVRAHTNLQGGGA